MMLHYVYGHDQLVADFVAKLIPHAQRGFANATAIGICDDEGKLIAGLVYHNYDPEAGIIEISGAALPRKLWLTRGTIARMYQYPFLGIGVQMVVQRTPADDTRLLRQLAAYDYSFIKIPRLFGRGRDGVVCCLTYEDWASNKFNQRLKHHLTDDARTQEAA